jgi:hypothetical protein
MRTFTAVAFLLLASVGPAAGQERAIPRVYVFGETGADSEESIRPCGVSHRSAIAQAEATLRYNGVVIGSFSDPFDMYIILSAGETSAGWCAYSLRLTFNTNQRVFIPQTQETIFAPVTLCAQGSLLHLRPISAQSVINDHVEDYVNRCLSEYRGFQRY